ncbi:hypothetical protein OPV22_010792 [Ensete ventricosum]|uniref:C2H2-type domain-containing protein n=1 Tax=Ensete ventricosum TaxID=4639 RepID=A0AAV8Q3H1_ENSVE|nr:hypothetical protein OPV22_010792 [Ensete ventricosum]
MDDDFANELEFLLHQSSTDDTSFPSEKSLYDRKEDQCSSFNRSAAADATTPALAESAVFSAPPFEHRGINLYMNQPPVSSSQLHPKGRMDQSNASATPFENSLLLDKVHPTLMANTASAFLNQAGFGIPTSDRRTNHAFGDYLPEEQLVPPPDFVGWGCRASQLYHHTLQALYVSYLSYLNPTGDPLDPNWEAIESYLAGHVRPGPDVARVYKCNICSLEFPSAQAYGGHMSSHSKTKRRKKALTARKAQLFKKVRFDAKLAPASKKVKAMATGVSSKENPSVDLAKNGVHVNEMGPSEKFTYINFINNVLSGSD